MRISISLLNKSVTPGDLAAATHAIQKQVHQDFAPRWGMDADLRTIDPPHGPVNPEASLSDVIIYVGALSDDPKAVDKAIGYHTDTARGVPYGFVFTDVAQQAGEAWQVTLSHEVLELIADPDVNLMVLAPHPKDPKQLVLRPYEVADPVQGDTYSIDGVPVSNFVLPLYFAELQHPGHVRTNFLGEKLDRFGVRPGGYFSYLDLEKGQYVDVFGEKVTDAMKKAKQRVGSARRQARRASQIISEAKRASAGGAYFTAR